MTTIEFCTHGSRITGFDCRGHAGFAGEGEDIVCAAVTSAIRFTECAINDVMGIGASVKVNRRKGSISLRIPAQLNPEAEHLCQTVLSAFMVYSAELRDEYPENIEVLDTGAVSDEN